MALPMSNLWKPSNGMAMQGVPDDLRALVGKLEEKRFRRTFRLEARGCAAPVRGPAPQTRPDRAVSND